MPFANRITWSKIRALESLRRVRLTRVTFSHCGRSNFNGCDVVSYFKASQFVGQPGWYRIVVGSVEQIERAAPKLNLDDCA